MKVSFNISNFSPFAVETIKTKIRNLAKRDEVSTIEEFTTSITLEIEDGFQDETINELQKRIEKEFNTAYINTKYDKKENLVVMIEEDKDKRDFLEKQRKEIRARKKDIQKFHEDYPGTIVELINNNEQPVSEDMLKQISNEILKARYAKEIKDTSFIQIDKGNDEAFREYLKELRATLLFLFELKKIKDDYANLKIVIQKIPSDKMQEIQNSPPKTPPKTQPKRPKENPNKRKRIPVEKQIEEKKKYLEEQDARRAALRDKYAERQEQLNMKMQQNKPETKPQTKPKRRVKFVVELSLDEADFEIYKTIFGGVNYKNNKITTTEKIFDEQQYKKMKDGIKKIEEIFKRKLPAYIHTIEKSKEGDVEVIRITSEKPPPDDYTVVGNFNQLKF